MYEQRTMYAYLVRLKICKLSPSIEVDYFICIAFGKVQCGLIPHYALILKPIIYETFIIYFKRYMYRYSSRFVNGRITKTH